nr:5'-nucleotidase domain-containing protein 4 isoform X3 [Tanacetum cinerariifolium]
MLKMLKTSGRAVFLVTNSLWDYTNVVMNYVFGERVIDGSSSLSLDWLQHFDFIITGSAKPGFFYDENRANLFMVETDSGKLVNTYNGTPLAQVGSPDIELPDDIPNKRCKVFQGGNVGHLHKLLKVGSSSQAKRARVRAAHQESQRIFHQKFHPVWGQLMKTGYQNSRFAHQTIMAHE